MNPLLQIKDLNVRFSMPDKDIFAVRDASLTLMKGSALGLVGESGCGKSVTAFSILRLIYPPGKIESGKIVFKDRDILQLSRNEITDIRGKEIAMIFQEPMTSLNPVFKVGFQIAETIRHRLKKNRKVAREMAIELLNLVGIPNPSKRYNSFPHELSGGMKQRVMIAIALSASPSILIADEPTTSLDVTIQAQILDLLEQLQEEKNMSLLLITHDLGVVANAVDFVAIMYAGEIVEYGSVKDLFQNPLHPYTISLFKAIPKIGENRSKLPTIPGVVPVITSIQERCIFANRCDHFTDRCQQNTIPLIDIGNNHHVKCINIGY
ncbi:MAG: ABC transporter ATP-binding protein [Spirochaetota bacterium]|nr:ABC transporter ATP-binding protein [Spirochaetota bacterium]